MGNGTILGRSVGLELTLDDFQKVSDQVPLLGDLKPSGKYVMEDIHKVWILFSSHCQSYKMLSLRFDTVTIVCHDKY